MTRTESAQADQLREFALLGMNEVAYVNASW